MAAIWSKKFYSSKQWIKCRQSYITTVHGLCEKCSEAGLILHHKIHLTPININDTDITLNHDNLQFLCLTCHNIHHHGNGDITAEGVRFDERGNLIQMIEI